MDDEKTVSDPVNTMDFDESTPANPNTTEVVLAAVMSYSLCPVCFEQLMPPIYQCCNGHIICSTCIERIEKCVECRLPFSQLPRIRNIALEKIRNNLPVDCANKNEGCNQKVIVEFLRDHLHVCPYTSVNFCANLLGWKNCRHPVNDFSVLSHLEACHSITKVDSGSFQMCLNVARFPLGDTDVFFEPLMVTAMRVPLLIRSVVSTDGYFTTTGLILNNVQSDLRSIRLKFRINSPMTKVSFEWSGFVQSYRTFDEANMINSLRIPVDSLIEFWGPKADPRQINAINLRIDVWEQSVLSQEDKINEEVHIFEQKQYVSRASTTVSPDNQSGNGNSPDVLHLDFSPIPQLNSQ